MQHFTRLETAVDWAAQQGRPVVFTARDPQNMQAVQEALYLYDERLTRVAACTQRWQLAGYGS